jgi:Bacterial regulatory proteins, crp family
LTVTLEQMHAGEPGRFGGVSLDLSLRLKAQSDSASESGLHMSRTGIGSDVGLKRETVSRTFTSLWPYELTTECKKNSRSCSQQPFLSRETPMWAIAQTQAHG